ncbi:MAG: hypothetical protein AB7O38_13035 [Pirellulaceae bacterium]
MATLAEEMKAHALEAQRFSRKHLVLELDFSEASVAELDNQCDSVEFAIRGGKTAENVDMLTRIWGAYVGESLRRVTKSEWCEVPDGAAARRGLCDPGGETVFPHDWVRARLVDKSAEKLSAAFSAARARLAK